MKLYLPLLIIALLAGCATVSKPVPDDYQGPVVQLADTGMQEDGSKGQFFAALEIDGKNIGTRFGRRELQATAMGLC